MADNTEDSSISLVIPVESFEVDTASIRREEGDAFKKDVSEKDKRRTRTNMLGSKLLDGVSFPTISIRSKSWSGDFAELRVNAEITVKDQKKEVEIPASVSVSDEQIVATGFAAVTHGQLGLNPFTAIFGGLRVRDEMEIRFQITAKREID